MYMIGQLRRTTPTIVLIEVAITTIQIAATPERVIAITTILLTAIRTMVPGSHSNTILRLYILRNVYSKSISIKEICSFLK